MIETFYDAIIAAETWFFGGLMNDAFLAGVINILNALTLLGMFYGVIWFPLRWCIKALINFVKRAGESYDE